MANCNVSSPEGMPFMYACMYALKQFWHFLLGQHFEIVTDHAPLQWLSAQKMAMSLHGLLHAMLVDFRFYIARAP